MLVSVPKGRGGRGALRRATASARDIRSARFAWHVGVLTAANGVSAALSFVQGILVARWLGPELYGVAALVMSFPALVYTFFDARSSEASVKYLSEFHARGERDQALAMCKMGYEVDLAIALLAFLVVVVTAPWAARSIAHRPEAAWLIIVYSAAFIPRAFVGTSRAVLATLGQFTAIAVIEALTTMLRVGLVLALVLTGRQVAGVVLGNALSVVVTGVLYGATAYGLVRRTWNAPWLAGRWQALKGYRRAILGFLACNDLNALLGMIPKQLDVVLLGYFRNPTEVSYYKLAKSAASVVGYLVGPLQSVSYPDLARLWGTGGTPALRQKVRKLAFRVGLPLGLVMLVGTALVPFVLPALVGRAYQPAVPATQVLLLGSVVWLALFWLRPAYFALARIRKWTVGTAVYSLCFLALSVVTIPKWGHIGAAISLLSMTVTFHLWMVVTFHATQRDSRNAV